MKEAIRHIRAEAELVDIFRELIDALGEREAMFGTWDTLALLDMWKPIKIRLSAFRDKTVDASRESLNLGIGIDFTSATLNRDARCIEFTLAVRLSCFFQRLPYPIALKYREPSLTWMGITLLEISISLMALWNQVDALDTPFIPTYHINIIAGAIITTRRAANFAPLHRGVVGIEILEAAERKAHESGGFPARILAKFQETIGDMREPAWSTAQMEDLPFDPMAAKNLFNMFGWGLLGMDGQIGNGM